MIAIDQARQSAKEIERWLYRALSVAIVCPGPSVMATWGAVPMGIRRQQYGTIMAVNHGILACSRCAGEPSWDTFNEPQADWVVFGDENYYSEAGWLTCIVNPLWTIIPKVCAPNMYRMLISPRHHRKLPLSVSWESMDITHDYFTAWAALLLAIRIGATRIHVFGMDWGGMHGVGPQVDYGEAHWEKERQGWEHMVERFAEGGREIRRVMPARKGGC